MYMQFSVVRARFSSVSLEGRAHPARFTAPVGETAIFLWPLSRSSVNPNAISGAHRQKSQTFTVLLWQHHLDNTQQFPPHYMKRSATLRIYVTALKALLKILQKNLMCMFR